MNADRRKRIAKIIEKVREIESELGDFKDDLDVIREEEQESFDNMPESLQSGENGQKCQQSAESLDDGVNQIDCALVSLGIALECMESIE